MMKIPASNSIAQKIGSPIRWVSLVSFHICEFLTPFFITSETD